MALSTATVTMDLSDLLGVDFDARRTKVWISTNVPDDTVIDTSANKIRLGSGNVTVSTDGTASLTVWVPGPDANPTSWQTTIHVDYPDRNEHGGRGKRSFGPFTITASADLADLVGEQEVPPTYISALTAELDTYATNAANSAAVAESAASLATAITGLDNADDAITLLDATPSSDFRVAQDARLSATIALAAPAAAKTVIASASAQNVKAANLIKFRAKAAAVRAGTADAKVLVVGDSTSWGTGGATVATSPPKASWSAKVADSLRGLGLDAYVGLAIPPNGGAATDNRFTIGAGWTGSFFGFGNNARLVGAIGSGALVFTPGRQNGPVDAFDVYFIASGAAYKFTTTLPDGTSVTHNVTPASGVAKVTVTGTVRNVSNSISITVAADSPTDLSLIGIEAYHSTRRRIRIGNGAVGGTSTTGWNTTAYNGALSAIGGYAPDLTFISLGLNDTPGGSTVAATKALHKTNMTAIIQKAQLTGDVVLITPNPMLNDGSPTGQAAKLAACIEAQYELAEEFNLPVIDINARLVSYAVANPLGMFADTLHPSDKGYTDWASAVTNFLTAALGSGNTIPETVRVAAGEMNATEGSPAFGTVVTYFPVWDFDAAANEAIGFVARIPDTWATYDIALRGTNRSPGTGAVVLRAAWGGSDIGGALATVGGTQSQTVTVLAENVAQEVVLKTGAVAPTTPGAVAWIQIQRRGADAGDTKPGDYGVIEVVLQRRS